MSNPGGNNAALRRGFIQFAGITAGRVQSFFDFYADNYNYEGIANSDIAQNVFAYTYNVGRRFSATLSLEDRNARNLRPERRQHPRRRQRRAAAARYAGETIPDIVGVLALDQAWARPSSRPPITRSRPRRVPSPARAARASRQDTDGFAVQGGVRLKLPMLAAGDDLWIEGAYQQGAYLYQDSGSYMNPASTRRPSAASSTSTATPSRSTRPAPPPAATRCRRAKASRPWPPSTTTSRRTSTT